MQEAKVTAAMIVETNWKHKVTPDWGDLIKRWKNSWKMDEYFGYDNFNHPFNHITAQQNTSKRLPYHKIYCPSHSIPDAHEEAL